MGAGSSSSRALLRTPRFILLCIECFFSVLVLSLAAAWVNALSTSNVSFALFVGLTSMILCGAFIAAALTGKSEDRTVALGTLVLTAVWWVFWLSAAAATSSTTQWANSWRSAGGWDCGRSSEAANSLAANGFSYVNVYCNAYDRVPVLRACCAFCWLTWALWSGSLFFCIKEDVMGKRVLGGGAADAAPAAGTPAAAAPAAAPAPPKQVDAV